MQTTEIAAYTFEGELLRFPAVGSWVRHECSCGSVDEYRIEHNGHGEPMFGCVGCGATIFPH